jgi:hypothetical protein
MQLEEPWEEQRASKISIPSLRRKQETDRFKINNSKVTQPPAKIKTERIQCLKVIIIQPIKGLKYDIKTLE